MSLAEGLESWKDGPTKSAIVDLVDRGTPTLIDHLLLDRSPHERRDRRADHRHGCSDPEPENMHDGDEQNAAHEPSDPIEHLRRAEHDAESVGDRRLADVVELYTLRARSARGVDVAEETTALAERLAATSPPLAALAFALASNTTTDAEVALARAERAVAILAELGTLEEDEAEVSIAHAEALEALGRSEEAREVRTLARAGLVAAARRIADPSWRERWLRDVPAHRALMEGA